MKYQLPSTPAQAGQHPNPVIARYRALAGQTVELQVFSLLTSRQVLIERLPATTNKEIATEYALDVRQLPSGQYSYRFVVNGRAQTSHHFAIQK